MANLEPAFDISKLATIPTALNSVDDSELRSYYILDFIIGLLEAGTPGDVVLNLARSLRRLPEVKQ